MATLLKMTTPYDLLVTHCLKQLPQPEPPAQSEYQTLSIIRYALINEQMFKTQTALNNDVSFNC
jgi:hypothetical protein